jgi:hypothetical protein
VQDPVQARVGVRAPNEQVTIVQNKEEIVRRALLSCLHFKLQRDIQDLPALQLPFK